MYWKRFYKGTWVFGFVVWCLWYMCWSVTEKIRHGTSGDRKIEEWIDRLRKFGAHTDRAERRPTHRPIGDKKFEAWAGRLRKSTYRRGETKNRRTQRSNVDDRCMDRLPIGKSWHEIIGYREVEASGDRYADEYLQIFWNTLWIELLKSAYQFQWGEH